MVLAAPPTQSRLGGTDPDRFDPKEAWYPVYFLEDLDPKVPAKFTLLDQDLVIWWDRSATQWRAHLDRCPHRLAPLSEGRIAEDGTLECPYHGWAFSGDGSCDRIPQQAPDQEAQTSRRACLTSFATAVAQGLLFVYAGDASNAESVPLPLVEPIEDGSSDWVLLNISRDLPYDALTLLENVLDPSHVPFTHHKSVGNRSTAGPVELELVTSDKTGFIGTWADGPRRGQLGRQDTTFIAPGLMWHDLTSKQFGRTMTVVYATPIRKGECRVFARFPFKFTSKVPATFIKLTPQWFSHLGQNAILEDDQIFLHAQERYLEQLGDIGKAFYLPTKADRFVFEYRQWLTQFGADPFPGQALPPKLPSKVLLDRYESHTKHCRSCHGALARIRSIKIGCAIGAFALIATGPIWGAGLGFGTVALLCALSLALAGAALGLSQLERRFYEGRVLPPRNRPEKVTPI
jgi:phenylpropionate dioxygenase-like ring-hydroxylating dioxygenase large terminal subunit